MTPTSDTTQAETLDRMEHQAAREEDKQRLEDHKHGQFYGGSAAAQVRRNRQWQKDLEAQEDSRR